MPWWPFGNSWVTMRRDTVSDRIVLRLDEVPKVAAFLQEHSGEGHETFVYRRGKEQNVVCKCGMPDGPRRP